MSKEAFEETLANAPFIALASSVDDQPNVRLVDTYYDKEKGMLLFPTSRKHLKFLNLIRMQRLLLLQHQAKRAQLSAFRKPK